MLHDGRYDCLHGVVQQHWCQAHIMATKLQLVLLLELVNEHRLHGRSGQMGSAAIGSAAYCMLSIAYCLLPIAYCLLSVVCCLLSLAA
jgi:hypothetical protein